MGIYVIGLDGIDWKKLERFIEAGDVPNIESIYSSGVHGDLRSVDPPISVPAWLCFSTGKKPDKLDLYNFTVREEGTYNMHKVYNSEKFQRDAFWNLLDNVGVLGVPSMFPTDELDGFMVSGPFAPSKTVPEDFEAEVEEAGYSANVPNMWKYDECLQHLEKEGDFFSSTLESRDPDFFMAVTSVTDRVQHSHWKDEEKIRKLYQRADKQVGKVLEHVDEGDSVFVISDHGFEGIEKTFYLNSWLREHGYLSTKSEAAVRKEDLRFKIKKFSKNILSSLGFIDKALELAPDKIREEVTDPDEIWGQIDWKNTEAFSSGQYVGQIYINKEDLPEGKVSEENYEDVRDRIIADLKDLEDPDTGGKVVEKIWKREELYRDFGERAPDITFYTTGMKYKVKEEIHSDIFDESIPQGSHGLEGVFLADGPEIKNGKVDLDLVDVAPTLLHMIGQGVPSEMDGEVVKEIFEKNSGPKSRNVRYEDDEVSGLDI